MPDGRETGAVLALDNESIPLFHPACKPPSSFGVAALGNSPQTAYAVAARSPKNSFPGGRGDV